MAGGSAVAIALVFNRRRSQQADAGAGDTLPEIVVQAQARSSGRIGTPRGRAAQQPRRLQQPRPPI
jgi:iron complex outermembrane receptor protein